MLGKLTWKLSPRAPAFSAATAAFAVAWTLYAGKDLNWDLLHYHYYVAHAFLNGGLQRDYFGASAQSYLNPVGYLPFYAMVSADWHSVAVAVVLALAHAVNGVLLYRLAWRLFGEHAEHERAWLATLAAMLGMASAVFWATVGTSFLDPLLTVPMLGGLVILSAGGGEGATRRAALAGALFGAAAALKYSNALFALAAAPLAAVLSGGSARSRTASFAAYAAGGIAAVLVLMGPTVLFLWREFGNPVFPLLNRWFASPDFPPINVGAERFAPRSAADALLFPWRALSPESMVYAEISAPDLRFAALALLAATAAIGVVMRRTRLTALDGKLIAFFAAAYAVWLATSANARYGLLVLLLAGVLVARFAERVLPQRAVRGAILALLVLQVVACALISPTRYFIVDRWSERWLSYEPPQRARAEPALYLTVETQAMAAIAPFLHPESAFVNLRGQHSLSPESARLQRLLERHAGRVRALGRALRLQRDGRPRADVVEHYDSTLLRYGLRVDPQDCFTIPWRPRREEWLSTQANVLVTDESALRTPPLALVSCALRPGSWSPEELEEERRASALFDRMERDCRGLFRGQTAVTERMGKEWSRSYAGLEARLETREGMLALAPYFELKHLLLGTPADWERGVPPPLEPLCREGWRR